MKKIASIVSIVIVLLACASVSFAQQSQPAPLPTVNQAQSNFSLVASRSTYCVGEAPQYVITGTADLVGQYPVWTSTFKAYYGLNDPAPTQENTAYPEQMLVSRDEMSFLGVKGSVWTTNQAGTWKKSATIAGITRAVEFYVDFCKPADLRPFSIYLTPRSGTTLFVKMGANTTQDLIVMMEGDVDTSRISGWRVTVDNNPSASLVNTFKDGGFGNVFESVYPRDNYGAPPALSIRIPYPVSTLATGYHYFDITIQMVDGSEFYVSGGYPVRRVLETTGSYPAILPDSPLSCGPLQQQISLNSTTGWYAMGGNGAYAWNVQTVQQVVFTGFGRNIGLWFDRAGTYTATVTSGGQKATCTLQVVIPPFTVTPPTSTQPPPSVQPRP